MAEFITKNELKYKNWNEAFRDLAEDLKRMKNVARGMVSNPQGLYKFFDELVVLAAGENGYLVIDGDQEKVDKKLSELEKHLFTIDFMSDIEREKLSKKTIIRVQKLRNLSLQIFSIFCKNFIQCGMRPKPEKVIQEEVSDNKKGIAY